MSTHIFFSLCVPSPVATVKVPLSQPCFDHFFGPCFRGHDEGLLAFEALQGLPRPARTCCASRFATLQLEKCVKDGVSKIVCDKVVCEK